MEHRHTHVSQEFEQSKKVLSNRKIFIAPEVKQRKVFNKSMDMWSMGVIVYVSLSGVFPFEEDRDIYEQIRNSNFMFPTDPWETVSDDGLKIFLCLFFFFYRLHYNLSYRFDQNRVFTSINRPACSSTKST